VTPDHLDRYATVEEYGAAKARIFERQTADDYAIVPFGDELCTRFARVGQARLLTFGGTRGDVRTVNGVVTDSVNGLAVALTETRLVGAHNADNACAAALMARVAGIGVDAIAKGLRDFEPLGHRMQLVRELSDVKFFDDSKATNVGATVAALDGLPRAGGRVVLIAGGKHKGAEYTPIRERLERFGRAAVLIGEATPLLEADFNGVAFVVERATTMADAVQRAYRLARPGDLVLLAPACSSFDMFRSYAHRGDEFQLAARALTEADHGAR
jgi:UDP-N-acetylmuramoylalanine--D-glutamate ligase